MGNYWPRPPGKGRRRVAQLAPRVMRPVAVHVFVPGPHTTGDLAAEPVCDRDDCGHPLTHPVHRVPDVPDTHDERRAG